VTVQQQNPDGTWSDAEALPPQPGYDAEVVGHGPFRWTLYRDCHTVVDSGRTRTRLGAAVAIWLTRRQDGWPFAVRVRWDRWCNARRFQVRLLPNEPTSFRNRRLLAGVKVRWRSHRLDAYLLGRRREEPA